MKTNFVFFEKLPPFDIFPSKIDSKNDGEYHHISTERLIQLYQIQPKWKKRIFRDIFRDNQKERGFDIDYTKGGILVCPIYSGNYPRYIYYGLVSELPEELKNKMKEEENENNFSWCVVYNLND